MIDSFIVGDVFLFVVFLVFLFYFLIDFLVLILLTFFFCEKQQKQQGKNGFLVKKCAKEAIFCKIRELSLRHS